MADNVTLPGTGRSVATDQIGSDDYQRVKITQGVDGVNDGDVSTALPLPVRSNAFDVAVSITRPANTTPYSLGDGYAAATPAVGGSTLTGVARASGGSVLLTDLLITSSAPGAMQGRVWLFNQAVTEQADNAPMALSDADILNAVGVFPFTMTPLANNSFAHLQNLAKGATCVGSANLRFLVEVLNQYVPLSGEVLQVRASGLKVD